MAVTDELAGHLATALTLVVGTTVFYDDLPEDAPDGAIGVFEYDGRPAEHDLGAGALRLEFPGVQLMTRHTVHATGRARIRAAVGVMAAIANQTIGGVRYLGADLVSGPRKLKKDKNERHVFVASYQLLKAPSTT